MDTQTNWAEAAWQQVVEKIGKTSVAIGASFPNVSQQGRYIRSLAHDWVAGFWPGLLWLVYRDTRDERLKELAVQCEAQIGRTLWEFDFFASRCRVHVRVKQRQPISASAGRGSQAPRIDGRQPAGRKI
ncbi:hypothetical protein [Cohnella rhizosphaerae]|uniref:Uncharacterized protein n=1 Tax=Cohnella rhizosphaerae TaxID=1457232 RepID=A0A9X4QRY7_9BACL|nr:hypothetical protein [Cohnella rhizosphaerae]MDG0809546.1 hypothetical protein [Cohnella rhizosphaerae]